jgi:5-dehydro-4-deoxyglucarate dehydratase
MLLLLIVLPQTGLAQISAFYRDAVRTTGVRPAKLPLLSSIVGRQPHQTPGWRGRFHSMSRAAMTPQQMAQRVGEGLLSFPVTHFNEQYDFAEQPYRQHLAWLLDHGPAALFAAGGTGEFFSLAFDEFMRVVSAAVSEVAGKVPVIAGCGCGTRAAIEFAQAGEKAGADGILLFPPYLVHAEPAGLVAHAKAVCDSTRLGVIFYNRDNAVLDESALEQLCQSCPNLVGFKDGVGDLELMTRIHARLGDRLVYIGGLPTAETFALPYLELGVTTYSSAIFNFLPKFAQEFYAAVRRRDHAAVLSGLRDFVLPYIAIRRRRKGYAVSIVKAGLKAVGRDAGPVRPPLVELSAGETDELIKLIAGRN